MKYKLAFVKEVNKNYIWYKEELKPLFNKYDMGAYYESKIESIERYRWWPSEVFAALERS
jgi:hypothetical protein